MKLESGSIQLTNMAHLGIAVKDAEETVKYLSSVWNMGNPEVIDYEPLPSEMIYGEPFKVKLVNIKFGAIHIELLQPMDD
ncbi:MAG TPA: hypothetical protein VFD19_05225, partial [Clostridia bacterium]|nr:hypothetical protein [Clostridia bacterium]